MLAERLRKVLGPDALVTPDAKGSVTLREQDVMDVMVAQVPLAAIAVNLEKMGGLSGVKKGPWRQRCDYMFVLDTDGKDHEVVFIELKKSLDAAKKEKAMEQLRRSPPVLMYLKSLCDLQYNGEVELSSPSLRYLVIGEKSSERLDKQRVRPVPARETETFKKIQVGIVIGSHFGFESLVRG